MRQMLGTFLLGIAGIAATVFAIAADWPWRWWAWAAVAVPSLIGGVLMIWRDRKPDRSASPRSGDGGVTASGERSVALETNLGIVSTGDDATIER